MTSNPLFERPFVPTEAGRRALALYAQGFSTREIALALDTDKSTVVRGLRKLGATLRPPGNPDWIAGRPVGSRAEEWA